MANKSTFDKELEDNTWIEGENYCIICKERVYKINIDGKCKACISKEIIQKALKEAIKEIDEFVDLRMYMYKTPEDINSILKQILKEAFGDVEK